MAFGIDDALAAAAAAINLTDTVVETIKRCRREKKDQDLELLIEEIRITALKRIDDADFALVQFERLIAESKKVDINKRIADVIADTPFWRPFQQYRLSQIQKNINALSDSIYSAGDDIAALLRCRGKVEDMGIAVVETAKRKHELHARLLHAKSLKEAIDLLRAELVRHKEALK
jgi:hypothetical protein